MKEEYTESIAFKIVIEKSENLEKENKAREERMKEEFSKPITIKLFENTEGYDEIIVQKDIPFMALCEHHGVAFEGTATVAYIPGKYITGLSKLTRIVEHYLNPTVKTVQERATMQILDIMEAVLKPKGVMVILKAKHGCLCYRGAKKPSITITSANSGVFRESDKTRQELLSLIKI